MPSASSKRESCEIQYAYTDDGVRYIAVRYKSGKTDILTQAEYRRLYPIQQQGTKENTTVLEITKAAFGVLVLFLELFMFGDVRFILFYICV